MKTPLMFSFESAVELRRVGQGFDGQIFQRHSPHGRRESLYTIEQDNREKE